MEDKIILDGICRKDQDALKELFEKYGKYVVAVISKVSYGILNEQDIEEITSDVFTNVWKKGPELCLSHGKLKNLIGVISRNRTLNAIRDKNRKLSDHLDEEIIFYPSAEDRFMEKEAASALWEIINNLDAVEKEIFLRRYFYLEKVRDIAREKQMNEKTVSSKLARVRQRLQTDIETRGIREWNVK
ncbi:RNA polymerase sigma factor [Anaerovorax odorimutans]|uniref:RNA polymerase sigma factor n=1 Tax=Anaerovorax odorimutans TaxID=109327 RepID=UPI0004266309|nr:sigma-70 family RNA polymerase sigma factor [Anaerovorax odorimutans]